MSRELEIKNLRIAKIKRLEEAGMKAYVDPGSVKQDLTLAEVNQQFSELEKSGAEKSIVGRIMVKRGAGKIAFAKIFDGTDEFQVVLKADELDPITDDSVEVTESEKVTESKPKKTKIFEKLFDMGDFAEFSGSFFTTEKGQPSMLVKEFRMLTKSLLPLPEKFHGLQDIEEKYRKRYLDVLTDQNAFERFKIRAQIIAEIRKSLDEEGFLEIETPILQNQASGAMAETFNTHHNDYDLDMVLRISLEAEHKMVMTGGYPAVYEIGRNFRNEGSDSTHMQEFTMIEWYKAYEGLEYNMNLTEKMLKNIAEKVVGKTKFEIENHAGEIVEIDFGKKWERVEFAEIIEKYAGINVLTASKEELIVKAVELGEDQNEAQKMSTGNLADSIWKKSARRKIVNPTWVTRYPGNLKPLAIQNQNGTAEVAQPVVAGFELSNHYAELVDPIVQRKMLEDQVQAKEDGDAEAMDMNNEFLTAMEYGMPPMTGTGIGIDRLVGIFTEQNNLRDTILFPLMKPEGKKKSKDTQISVAVLNQEANLEKWQELNAIGHLTAALGAREGRKMFYQDELTTQDNKKIKLNTEVAIIIKTTETDQDLKDLLIEAKKNDLKISEFTRRMLEISDDKKLVTEALSKDYNQIEHLGVLVFGKKSAVEKITKKFKLYN